MQETQVRSLGQEDPLEETMATHSRILAWRIPRMEEPGGLQSLGSQSWTRLRDEIAATAASEGGDCPWGQRRERCRCVQAEGRGLEGRGEGDS